MGSRKILALICTFLIGPLFLNAQNSSQPKLIVSLIVDPLGSDYLDRCMPHFGEGGFKKLINQGKSFDQAASGLAFAERASSLASIFSGCYPSTHGIIGQSWYDRLSKQEVECTEDYRAISFNAIGHRAKHSSKHLLVTTLGDQIRSQSEGKVVSICLEPDGAILSSGHLSDRTFWYDSYSGSWTSNRSIMDEIPQWVIDFNNHNTSDKYLTEEWDILIGAPGYEGAQPDANLFESGLFGTNTSFPYKLRRMKKNVTEGEYEVLRHVPYGNKLTAEFAVAAIHNEQLGLNKETDLLNIVFTGLSKIVDQYGIDSQEATDALVRLDLEIQHLLYIIEENIGKDEVLIMLTGTHGTGWNTNRAIDQKLPSGKFRARNAVALLNSYLSAVYGENYWIESYINQQIYLDHTVIDQSNIPIHEIQEKAARFLTQFQGVAHVLTADRINFNQMLQASPAPLSNAFYFNRSGDLLIQLRPGWIQDGDFVSDHLSHYPYDQNIALVFWGMGIEAGSSKLKVEFADICPTISELLKIPLPNASSGKSFRQELK